MQSINLTNLCMEEDDQTTTKKKVYCNHGFVILPLLVLEDQENIDPKSKFVIPKLIEKLGELENLVESSQTSVIAFELIEVFKEVDKPRDFKQDDNCPGIKLQMLQEEVEKMK
ncbi:hypothetical protein H5410_045029 [Solanum commersonii]|uniref:Uncharacterized protein n=1 Tax=Solanum commersonii TaxID=4109 RepID=A0A9J5X8K1_SOLCO|nr:hypothetical protein H5410_045029 [Solanum commersonii]